MMLMAKNLTALTTRLAKMRYVQFYLWSDDSETVLIPSAGIKLIAVDDSDPDSTEYVKPRTSAGNKANAKVGVLSCVYDYKGVDNLNSRF